MRVTGPEDLTIQDDTIILLIDADTRVPEMCPVKVSLRV